MIDISKEGFVGAKLFVGDLMGYLFYLTYDDRAMISNSTNSKKTKLDYKDNNVEYYYRYLKERNKEFTKSQVKGIELVLSFSAPFQRLMIIHYGKKQWEQKYNSIVSNILEDNLKGYKGFNDYTHQYDKTGYRLHNHVMIYPYKESNKVLMDKPFNFHTRMLKKELLENIKTEYRKFAKKMYDDIPNEEREMLIKYIDDTKVIKSVSLLNTKQTLENIEKYFNKNKPFIKVKDNEMEYSKKDSIKKKLNKIKYKTIIKSMKEKDILEILPNIMNEMVINREVFNDFSKRIDFKTLIEYVVKLKRSKKISKNSNVYLQMITLLEMYQKRNKYKSNEIYRYLLKLKTLSIGESKSIVNSYIDKVINKEKEMFSQLDREHNVYHSLLNEIKDLNITLTEPLEDNEGIEEDKSNEKPVEEKKEHSIIEKMKSRLKNKGKNNETK